MLPPSFWSWFASAAAQHSRELDAELLKEKKRQEKQIKFLILGSSGCGKSTIMKRIQMAYANDYGDHWRLSMRRTVFENCVSSMMLLRPTLSDRDEAVSIMAKLMCDNYLRHCQIEKKAVDGSMTLDVYKCQIALWEDKTVQKKRKTDDSMQGAIDSAEYFMSNLDRICSEGYIPTDQDILRLKTPSKGVSELNFWMDKNILRFFEVVGHGSRSKWSHCFEDVTAVIYVVALVEDDNRLKKGDNSSHLAEALQQFGDFCNEPFFIHTTVLLFLTKKDVLEKQLAHSSFGDVLPEYSGDNSVDSFVKYIVDRFVLPLANERRRVYAHAVNAVDVNEDIAEYIRDEVIDTESARRPPKSYINPLVDCKV